MARRIVMWMAVLVAGLVVAPAAMWAGDGAPLTPVGKWKTIDDKTGKPKAIVEIYLENGRLFGKIAAALDPEATPTCEMCKDERKNRPIVGLVILRGLVRHSEEYSGGDILDPDNGTVYRCKLRLADGGRRLIVRGFLGLSVFGRSQTWTREPE
jgi:uncharacterized protein (DUF2147 family)